MSFFIRVLPVAVDGKSANVLSLLPLHVKDHTDVFRQVLQIPLVNESVDLSGFFIALNLRVGVVGHSDEANPPDGEQTVDVLLHQLHVPGKSGLALAEDDLKFLLLGRLDHPVEVWTQAVGTGVVLVAVDMVDVPSPLHGVVDQKGLLVLDALGFLLLLVFVLLTQSCIDRTKNMSHLLKGVTAQFHLNTESSYAARNYLKSLRHQNVAQGSFGEFFCKPGYDGLLDNSADWELVVGFSLLCQDKGWIFHENTSRKIYECVAMDMKKQMYSGTSAL